MTTCPTCGVRQKKIRSPEDHRRFFGIISAAYHHWPEAPAFQPDDPEHLRSWLLCEARYRNATEICCDWIEESHTAGLVAVAIEAAIKAAHGRGFVRVYDGRVIVVAPKSIAFEKLGQDDFNVVRNAVEAVIRAETGLDPDTLLQEWSAET